MESEIKIQKDTKSEEYSKKVEEGKKRLRDLKIIEDFKRARKRKI